MPTKYDLTVTVAAAKSPDGRVTQLQFVRADGRTSYIDILTAHSGHFLASMQNALAGRPPGELPPARPASGHVTKAEVTQVSGQAALNFALASGQRLDLTIEREVLSDMIDELLKLWWKDLDDVPAGPTKG